MASGKEVLDAEWWPDSGWGITSYIPGPWADEVEQLYDKQLKAEAEQERKDKIKAFGLEDYSIEHQAT